MKNCLFLTFGIAISIGCLKFGLSEEPLTPTNKSSDVGTRKSSNKTVHPTVEESRRQAEILHTVIGSTLRSVHDRYYRPDEGLPVPAAVLKELFPELEHEHQVKLRWLAVEGQAMNSDHKPQTPFENDAVTALKSGMRQYEQTENGVYRRAGTITLSNHCLKCHVPDRKNTKDRVAGLIIAISIEER